MASSAGPPGRGHLVLARKARALIAREDLFPTGSRALVMVSGGQDSLALLHLLATGAAGRGGPAFIHALHVNHHLRGAESDDDEALVVRACASLGVSLTVRHRAVDKRKGNVQEAARDARREAAVEVAVEQRCDRIVLGHTADDQVETMLYRLGRYGGLASLAGMPAYDAPWVRPLLGCRRAETAAYCADNGLEFACDTGNRYAGYARTAIRQTVLPAWEAALPGAVDAAARAAEVAAEMKRLTAEVMDRAARDLAGAGDMAEAAELSVAKLNALSPSLRRLLLHAWLEGRARPRASRASVLAVESLLNIEGSAERSLGGGWRARKEYDRVSLEQGPRPSARVSLPVSLPLPGCAHWGGHTVCAERTESYHPPDIASEAFLDEASLDAPLEVRGPRSGDRLRPLGSPGTRKLQDVFVDLRIPAAERRHRPLVVCGERIVWVAGLVLAEEGRITATTTRIVRLTLSRGEDMPEAGSAGRSVGG